MKKLIAGLTLMALAALVFTIWLAQPDKNRQSGKIANVKVTRVIDGDTIEIEGGRKVRYIGINTPETKDPRRPVQCFGKEASNQNKKLVEGKNVVLEKDVKDQDKYGRLLRYVWINDEMVNKKLVEEGYAFSAPYPPNVKYQHLFLEAEREARRLKKGLWSSCPQYHQKKIRK